MGRVKEYMIAQQELEATGASLSFNCPECGRSIEHYCPIPVPDLFADRQRSLRQSDTFELECHNCSIRFNGIISNDGAFCEAKLNDLPDWFIQVELPPGYDDLMHEYEYLFDYPSDPEGIFNESFDEIIHFLILHGTEKPNTLTNRMAFTQGWSAFEAYLSDKLALSLEEDRSKLIRFVRSDQALRQLKLEPVAILAGETNVEREIIKSIRGRLYHKFDKLGEPCSSSKDVPKWYRVVLNVEIADTTDELDNIRKLAAMRHDCVHRNGKDRDGNENALLTKQFVEEALMAMKIIVSRIEQHDRDGIPF